MLFNSFIFLFGFLPVTLIVTAWLRRCDTHRPTIIWLTIASLFFYGWWNPVYVALIAGSTLANYGLAQIIVRLRCFRTAVMIVGVAANLAVLGWFKYAGFATQELRLLGMEISLISVVLPLGISFFTFQKIAYLVDNWRGDVDRHGFLDFSLFVLFFPQLIAAALALK